MDAASPYELLVIVGVLVAAALVRVYTSVDDETVARWARERGIGLDAETAPEVERYLRRSRVCRGWGAVAGLFAPTLILAALGEPVRVAGVGEYRSSPGDLGLVFVGYLAGALWAELAVARPFAPGRRRAAALLPRELGDYLPRWVVWLQRGLAAGGVAALLALPLVARGPGVATPSWGVVIAMAALTAGFAFGLERLEAWIVRRPQPFISEPRLQADDAIRAQSVHAVAGAGVALLLFDCGLAGYSALAASELELVPETMLVPGVFAVAAFLVCRFYGDRAWRVRRRGRAASA